MKKYLLAVILLGLFPTICMAGGSCGYTRTMDVITILRKVNVTF